MPSQTALNQKLEQKIVVTSKGCPQYKTLGNYAVL